MNIDYGGCKSNKIKACMNIAISSEVFMCKIFYAKSIILWYTCQQLYITAPCLWLNYTIYFTIINVHSIVLYIHQRDEYCKM